MVTSDSAFAPSPSTKEFLLRVISSAFLDRLLHKGKEASFPERSSLGNRYLAGLITIPHGPSPALMVAITLLVLKSITETSFDSPFAV
jgi:hypothetical protein